MHVVLGLGNGSGGVYIILQFVTLLYLQCVDMPYLVVCGHRARLSFQEASARTLVVLDVDGWKVKNTNIYIRTPLSNNWLRALRRPRRCSIHRTLYGRLLTAIWS